MASANIETGLTLKEIKPRDRSKEVRETLAKVESEAESLEGVIVLGVYHGGHHLLQISPMSTETAALMCLFLQSWMFKNSFREVEAN